jgi:hypothetical protein
MDIDGVLCGDPTPAENGDGPDYQRFLQGADPRAAENARLSGKSVFCAETRRMVDPALLPRVRRKTDDLHGVRTRLGRVFAR